MTLVRWNPVARDALWMDRIFDGLLHTGRAADQGWGGSWAPRADVAEEKDSYRIEMDLPGMRKEDVRITVQENSLEIKGERNVGKDEDSEGYRRTERVFGSFERVFRLPKGTDASKIESTYENGVLTIRVPKAEEALPRRIEVKIP
ncbi:MAG: Hsp20/alpha crystallin family protein [Candidatus Eisenbacteria bacterium]